jgi:hypothetical protein
LGLVFHQEDPSCDGSLHDHDLFNERDSIDVTPARKCTARRRRYRDIDTPSLSKTISQMNRKSRVALRRPERVIVANNIERLPARFSHTSSHRALDRASFELVLNSKRCGAV